MRIERHAEFADADAASAVREIRPASDPSWRDGRAQTGARIAG